jgi:tRNA (Thr-GGU) A37 N-methylase
VRSTLSDPATAPKQGDEGAPEAWIEVEAGLAEGLDGIEAGAELIVLTWLDRVRVLEVEGGRLRVANLEAVDGTPVLDLKPVLSADPGER